MVDRPLTHHAPRPRAVAELPVDGPLARAADLARRWAVALILARPAQDIGEVPLEDLARRAPALCAQALSAVKSDAELERLTGEGAPGAREEPAAARRLAEICGARDAVTVVESVEALRGVLWQALLDAVRDPSARLLGDLADRLAYVCSALLAAALDTTDTTAPPPAPSGPPAGAGTQRPDERRLEHRSASPRAERAVIVDERAPDWEEPALVRSVTAHGGVGRDAEIAAHAAVAPDAGSAADAEIAIRDQRRVREGPAAWVGLIGAQLERFEREGRPFAVLLVEPVDLERLCREESDEELWHLSERLEEALRAELVAWSGSLTRERPGRCWLLAPGVDRAGAERLAQGLLAAVGSSVRHGSAPLALAIGTAVCPEDGRRPAPLAAHADVGLYAARAAARAPAVRPAAAVDESA